MAKFIKFNGWIRIPGGEKKEEYIINTEYITRIEKVEYTKGYFVSKITFLNKSVSIITDWIYTELSVEDIIQLT